jgi:hypothetical protein
LASDSPKTKRVKLGIFAGMFNLKTLTITADILVLIAKISGAVAQNQASPGLAETSHFRKAVMPRAQASNPLTPSTAHSPPPPWC